MQNQADFLQFADSLKALRRARRLTRLQLALMADASYFEKTGQEPRTDTARLIKTLEYEGARDRAISRNLGMVEALWEVLSYQEASCAQVSNETQN